MEAMGSPSLSTLPPQPPSTYRKLRRTAASTSLVLLALAVAFVAVPTCQAARAQPAFVPGSMLVSGSARASCSWRTRRPGVRTLEMQQAAPEPEMPSDAGMSSGADAGAGNEPHPAATGTATGGFPALPAAYPPKRKVNYKLEEGQVGVRFINTSGDPDICIGAHPGELVTQVAKRAGVKIATACSSGLCGTCSTDLEDKNGKSYRPGFQIVRACVTPVTLVPGAEEMVLDVYRNKSKKGKLNKQLASDGDDDIPLYAETLGEAMSRFSEGWEDDFTPNYLGGSGPVPKIRPKIQKKRMTMPSVDPFDIKPVIGQTEQDRMANTYMRDDLPPQVRRPNPATSGREMEDKLDKAHQISLRLRLLKERRERINFYLDNADRPIATVEDLLTLSQEEVDSRQRFFNKDPDCWEDVYGLPNLPEVGREMIETNGRRSEGTTEARMAVYRAARQIPRYRFFGDPPLRETDANYLNARTEKTRISPDEAAQLDRLDYIKKAEAKTRSSFVYRDFRTGREVPPHKAGKPGTIRGEVRTNILPACPACEATGEVDCLQCRALGYRPDAKADHELLCPRCAGRTKITCRACDGTGVGQPTID